MSNLTLSFIQELRDLESEISVLLESAESPEECPELFPSLQVSIKSRLMRIIPSVFEMILIGQKVQLSVGTGEDKRTTNGLPVIADLLVESIMHLLLKVSLGSSGNLALSRDVIKDLYKDKAQEDFNLPSLSGKILNLIFALENMETQVSIALNKKEESNPEKK